MSAVTDLTRWLRTDFAAVNTELEEAYFAERAKEVLLLNMPDLDTANRRAVVTRKGGARDVIVWQTGTARLLAGARRPVVKDRVISRHWGLNSW